MLITSASELNMPIICLLKVKITADSTSDITDVINKVERTPRLTLSQRPAPIFYPTNVEIP